MGITRHPSLQARRQWLLGIGTAVCLVSAGHAQDPDLAPGEFPPPEQLEAQQVRIGKVSVETRNIFDLDNPDEDKTLYRWANKLHAVTKPHVIQSQLLFEEGDLFEVRLLDETERILRRNDYLRDATILPVKLEDGVVDLQVTTYDVWTLTPSLTAGREGGENRLGIGIKEQNLFGNGVLLEAKYRSDVDRESAIVDFADQHFRGTRNRLAFRIGENSDGYDRRFLFVRPFFALDSRRSNGISFAAIDRTDPLYDRGEIISDFQHTLQHHEFVAGWSRGLSNGWVRRYSTGLIYDDHEFASTPGTLDPDTLVPDDREYLYPYFGYELIQDHYVEAENFDRIGRVEDRFLGTRLAFRVGYAPTAFGSSADSWHYDALFSNAIIAGKKTSLTVATSVYGRFEESEAKNLLASFEARFHRRLTRRQLFYASLSGAVGDRLDLDNQLLLGGDSGLRGYPLRYQGGDSKVLLTLEHRIFTDWYPWRFFNVGGAIFFDAGKAWGENPVGGPPLGLLRDVGVGLRLGSNRTGEGGVLHIDFAFPLDGEESIDRFQILIDARSTF